MVKCLWLMSAMIEESTKDVRFAATCTCWHTSKQKSVDKAKRTSSAGNSVYLGKNVATLPLCTLEGAYSSADFTSKGAARFRRPCRVSRELNFLLVDVE